MSNSNFPSTLDTSSNLPDPSTSTVLATGLTGGVTNPYLVHHVQHSTVNDAVIALEQQVGINQSQDYTTPSHDLRLRVRENADYTITPSAMDDEFNAPTLNGTLWTWLNQNTATQSQNRSRLQMAVPKGNTSDNLNILMQPLPSGNSWSFETNVSIGGNNEVTGLVAGGLVLYESATGKLAFFNWYMNAGSTSVSGTYWTNTSTYAGATLFTAFSIPGNAPRGLRVTCTSTQYEWLFSYEGINFGIIAVTNHTSGFSTAADHIGLCVDAYNLPAGTFGQGTPYGVASFDYFRRLT